MSILSTFHQKKLFWGIMLVQFQLSGTGTWYCLKALHKCYKKVKTKSQKVLGVNSYFCGNYKENTGRGSLFAPPFLLYPK